MANLLNATATAAKVLTHDTLPWLISFSLGEVNACPAITVKYKPTAN
jgi:hypothetical protein